MPFRKEGHLYVGGRTELRANHIPGLKSLGAFHQVELHGLAFIEGAIAIFLNGGKMNEDVFSRRSLDKTVSFRTIEPLHSTFFAS